MDDIQPIARRTRSHGDAPLPGLDLGPQRRRRVEPEENGAAAEDQAAAGDPAAAEDPDAPDIVPEADTPQAVSAAVLFAVMLFVALAGPQQIVGAAVLWAILLSVGASVRAADRALQQRILHAYPRVESALQDQQCVYCLDSIRHDVAAMRLDCCHGTLWCGPCISANHRGLGHMLRGEAYLAEIGAQLLGFVENLAPLPPARDD